MMKKRILLGSVLILIVLSACNKGSKQSSEESTDESLVEITAEQFNRANMLLGGITKETFRDEVVAKGILQAPSDATAKVSAPVSGTVKSIRLKIGDYVKRGQIICTVGGNDFMSLQQAFAESAAAFQKAKADYERMQLLRAENIGAKKDYVSAESLFKSAQASYNALKARVQSLNVNTSQIENGQMYSSFPVVSPIEGYVTNTGVVVGQYVDMTNEIAEVVNTNKLQLKLSIFEIDIPKIKEGQRVRFNISGHPDQELQGTIITVGKGINPDTKSIDCIAQIDEESKSRLVSQSYVEAKVEVDSNEAMALPTTAVQKVGEEYIVFVVESSDEQSYKLRKTPVKVGKSNNDYFEIISGVDFDSNNIVLKGVDTL